MGTDQPPIDPDEARRAADDILSRPEYQEPEQNVVDRVLEWVFDQFGNLVERLTGGGPGSVIGWLVLATLVGGALWLLVRAVRLPRLRRVAEGVDVVYGTEAHRDAAVWLAEAARLAAAGDQRGALRCRHQALVATAVTGGRVDDVAGRTAGEYRELLTTAVPAQADALASITERFEAAWYGGVPVTSDDYERFAADAAAVEDALTRVPEPAGAR